MNQFAVLTSGGDSPGMNAAVRAVVRTSIYHKLSIFGVNQGYRGLIDDEIFPLDVYSVADIIQRGGTVLHTARSERMRTEEGIDKAAENLKRRGIDGLVIIGGDGSYRAAKELSLRGVNVVTLPGTIDNDIPCTDYTIGFDTAVNTAVDAISKIRDTTNSHNRVNIVQVMGRNSGNLALYSGLAGGAEAIVVPEMAYDADKIITKLLKGKERGKLHIIIVFAEGAGDLRTFCEEIETKSKFTTRTTVLGYIQRGGSPSAFDRILASHMGSLAVEVLMQGKTNRAICIQNNHYVDMDITEALAMPYQFNKDVYRIAMELSI
jgi:6-phosphofructokinase 1